MKNNRKFQRNPRGRQEQKKMLGALAIPLIVIVLIVVIVVADRCGRKEAEEESTEVVTTATDTMAATAESETENGGEPETVAESGAADAFSAENFERDGIPEILDLMKQYFHARATADAVAMNQLYGIGEEDLSVRELEDQKTRMRSNSKYVTGFENIATYVKPGKDSGSWLVYTTADIRFRSVNAAAPMIMWCYVTRDAEGSYLLKDSKSLPADVLAYVDAAGRSEEVRRLAADVNLRLKAALDGDADLQQVYGILNSDSPLWVDDDPNTDPELVILEDEPAADESSADGSSEDGNGESREDGQSTDEAENGRGADETENGTEETP